jgi:hypothetical protein
MSKTVNEDQTETVSRTLSGGTRHYLVEPEIVQMWVSRTQLKVGPCLGQVGHCLVGPDIVQ